MKIKYILPIVVLAAGCTPAIVGMDMDDYIKTRGVPTSEYTMTNGNTLYSYKKICDDKRNWEEYNIEVDPQNKIIKRTNVKTCPVDTQEKKCDKGSGKCFLKLADELARREV